MLLTALQIFDMECALIVIIKCKANIFSPHVKFVLIT